MQDLFLLLATVLFLAAGVLAPFVMSLAYLWVDVFTPQDVSESLLAGTPIALVFGFLAVVVYVAKDRRHPPQMNAITVLQILVLIWITLTLQWAVSPAMAEWRWGIASKVCLFAIFLPFVIRSRVQIEAMVLVYLFAICGHLMPWGIKTFITGGGYGQSLGLLRSNSALLAESSTVSGIAVAIVPLMLVMRTHSLLLPKHWIKTVGVVGVIGIGLAGAVGTFARTALVAAAVGGGAMWLRSKHKLLFLVGAAVMGGLMFSVTSDRWTQRISTVTEYENEGSAYVRILVWRWSWEFVQSHPFGGGFWAFMVNRIEVPSATGGPPLIQYARAYHNIFFGVLADQGYIGFGLYVGLIATVFLALRRARLLTRNLPEHAWCGELSQALSISLLTMLAAGMFVEIGWSPIIWYLFSMAVSLREYARRATRATPASADAIRSPMSAAPRPAQPAFGTGIATSLSPSTIRKL